jgi:transposase
MKLINAVRRNLPDSPTTTQERGARSLRPQPPSDDPNDPAVQRWQRRRAERDKLIGLVHRLAEQGYSQRAIERQTGFSRPTVKKWLKLKRPEVSLEAILATPEPQPVSLAPAALKRAKIRQAHDWVKQGLSYSEIARRVGAHRVTIKKSLQEPVPPPEESVSAAVAVPEPPQPPAPWTSWDQVSQIREALKEHRFLLLRRPEHLNEKEQAQVAALLSSPVGAELQVGRSFLVDWYYIWKDEAGQRRTLAEAQVRYETWQTAEAYAAVSTCTKSRVRCIRPSSSS